MNLSKFLTSKTSKTTETTGKTVMLTRSALEGYIKLLMTSFERVRHEREIITREDDVKLWFQPATEAKLILDTYAELSHVGESETFFMDDEGLHGLVGDHREALTRLDREGLKKYWRERSNMWTALPRNSEKDEEDEKKPEIGFGIPVAKAA